MPYRICKIFEIESGHLLSKHAGNCRFPHGHSRTVEVVVAAAALDANDMVCDFKALKETLADFLSGWDHALCVNTDDPEFAFYQKTYGTRIIPFAHTDPTSEVMARTIHDELKRRLTAAHPGISPNVRIERVRVTETASSWAEYAEE